MDRSRSFLQGGVGVGVLRSENGRPDVQRWMPDPLSWACKTYPVFQKSLSRTFVCAGLVFSQKLLPGRPNQSVGYQDLSHARFLDVSDVRGRCSVYSR
jgi:hypothetical protein